MDKKDMAELRKCSKADLLYIIERMCLWGMSGQRHLRNMPTLDPSCLYYNGNWVSVEDRLPEQCGMGCLLCGANCYGQQRVFEGFTGYMEGGKFQWHTNLKDIDMNVWKVTHWMPLPEPPKGE